MKRQKRRHAWKDKHKRKQWSKFSTSLPCTGIKPNVQNYWRGRRKQEKQLLSQLDGINFYDYWHDYEFGNEVSDAVWWEAIQEDEYCDVNLLLEAPDTSLDRKLKYHHRHNEKWIWW